MHAIASRDEMRHVLSRIITRPISTTKNKRFSSFFFLFFKGPDLQFCGECFKIVVSCCRLKSFTYCAGNLFKIDCQPLFVDAGERSWSGMACWTHVRSQHLIHCWESACSQSEGSTHLSNRFEPFFLQLCGVWQKIPTVYLQYFRQERLFAVITASKYPDGLVAGRIVPNDMTATGRFANNI